MTIDIAKLRALLSAVGDADGDAAEYDALVDEALAALPHLLDAAEERDAALLERMKAVEEATRLRAMRCDCDEEAGGHAGDCVTLMPEIIDGMREELDRLRANLADALADAEDSESPVLV